METSTSSIYEPLPNSTSIRILVLAPGTPDDDDLSFALITSDLDFDHKAFPDTAPAPLANIALVTGQNDGESDSHFPLHVDMQACATPGDFQWHPFQRYEALSYVWGDLDDQHQIFLGGDKAINITKNLHSALRSLRLSRGGRKLWIDALCINQSDHEEKKVQLALMKRVYQQADKVIAYLPLSAQDQTNLNELVPSIMRASMAYREHQASEQPVASDRGPDTGKLNSVSELETKTVVRDANTPMSVTLGSAFDDEQQPFLESFGLPREDSHLWDSWRRTFQLPYFRRIWIWQEMALGNNLHFWFGKGEAPADPLILSHHFLDEYGGSLNQSYCANWCASDDDNQDTLNDRIVGSGNATKMFRDRIFRVYGRRGDGLQPKLIRKLASVGTFSATDPRDVIYGLLGLASDGSTFTQHVSYAPWETKEKTFIRFASLFIDRSEGIEVLLQAGFRDGESDWPSWVPHWDSLERPVPIDAARGPGTTSTRMHVDIENKTLSIHGTILDTVSVINKAIFETLKVTENGVDMWRFVRTITSGLSIVFSNLSPRDPEEAFEQLFHVLAQPEKLKKPEQTESEASEGETPSSADELNERIKQNIGALRTGFREFLSYVVALKPQIEAVRSRPDEDITQVIQAKSPVEFQAFQRAAIKNLHHRLLCITKSERIIMAPKRTKIGDKVVLFEDCDIPFILRQNGDEGEADAGAESSGSDGKATYRLIGPAFLHVPEDEAESSEDTQEIMIM
ncbi:HET-domain-containing protein [Xylaria arbuscula]|nr:HET-domain-containing protein [Xylaria arbuscula]